MSSIKYTIKKISRKKLQLAMRAGFEGKESDEQVAIMETVKDNPGVLLGLSKLKNDAMNAVGRMIQDPESDQELLYVARALILCGLPYRKLVDGEGNLLPYYRRSARTAKGKVTLTIGASNPDIPLPYGKDRAVLAWVQSKALKQGNPTITWSSAKEFFDAFELSTAGYQYKSFKETWRRLANAVFTITMEGDDIGEMGQIMPLMEGWHLPGMKSRIDPPDNAEPILERMNLPTLLDKNREAKGNQLFAAMPWSVTLSPTLYKQIQENKVPLRLEVMRLFTHEPKAWDMASLISYRSWICQNNKSRGRESTARISWSDLVEQLGSVDLNHKQLRSTLRDAIRRILIVWPECQAKLLHGGTLEIKPPIDSVHPVKSRYY